MASWNSTTKSSAPSWSDPVKASTDFGSINQVKSGLGWLYDQVGITYDAVLDPNSGVPVFYDALGNAVTWVNQTRS